MDILIVKLLDHYVVELIMEAVGEKPRMEGHILLVLMIVQKVVCAHQDLEAMESVIVKMLMNAKKNWLVNAQSAIAKILGVVMTAPATEIYCICENMIHVSVKILGQTSTGVLSPLLLLLWLLLDMHCTNTGYGDTWLPRLGQSWHSTCLWMTNQKFQIMSRRQRSDSNIFQRIIILEDCVRVLHPCA